MCLRFYRYVKYGGTDYIILFIYDNYSYKRMYVIIIKQ